MGVDCSVKKIEIEREKKDRERERASMKYDCSERHEERERKTDRAFNKFVMLLENSVSDILCR